MPRIPQGCDCCHSGVNNSLDVKLIIMKEGLEKELVQRDLIGTFDKIKLDDLEDSAYLYVDNDGAPKRLKVTDITGKEISVSWDNLDSALQAKITTALAKQDKLTAGTNITIKDNVISATGGVTAINGKTGTVTLTAADLNALTMSETATLVDTKITDKVPTIVRTTIAEQLTAAALDCGEITD